MSEENQLPAKAIQQDFETAAARISIQLDLDYKEVKGAYADRPETLTSIFNAMEANRRQRNWNIGWTILAAPIIWPIALVTGYYAFKRHEKVNEAQRSVQAEILRFKNGALPAPGPAKPH